MEKDLRLRLVVRRHGVPDVKLLWNATADEDLTISKLLAQINEVVPLESGEWGLEDYAVELKDASGDAFECVHYHLVSKLLKDDDQVLVRPLLTGDLKRRRLSGRHQISIDGRHLVDGLAFGRPWLRAPRDRPAVALPPRKKARIAYGSEDEDSLPENDDDDNDDDERPMLEYGSTRAQEDPASAKLRTRFYDVHSDSDSEVEHDYQPDLNRADDDDDDEMELEDGDIQDELRLLKQDNAAVREGDLLEELRVIRDKRAPSGPGGTRHEKASGDSPAPLAGNALVTSGGRAARHRLNLDTLDKIAALRVAFPGAQASAIEETLLRYNADSARAYRKLRKTFAPRLSLQQTLDHQARSLSSSPIRHAHAHASTGRELVLRESSPSERASYATAPDEANEDDEDASITLNHNTAADRDLLSGQEGSDSSSDSESESDSDSDSDSNSDSDSGSSVAAATSDIDREAEGSSDDDSEASSSDDDDDSSQEGEDKEDGSSEPDGGGSVLDEEDADSMDQDASSSDDSSDLEASGSDGSSVAAANNFSKDDDAISISSDSSSDSESADSSSDESSSDSEPDEIPSKTLTSQRQILENSQPQASRKQSQAAPAAPAAPTVPPGQGLSKTQKRNARRKLAKQLAAGKSTSVQGSQQSSPAPATGPSVEEASFLARKQALLNAIASDSPVNPFSEESFQGLSGPTPQEREVNAPSTAGGTGPMVTSESPAGQAGASAQRRIKPNIGATRRMLMGSLGLKNPKTKADEDKIRQDLMRGVRPHTNARLTEASSQQDVPPQTNESVEEDPEAWREKIAYRAVECCHDGVELSEPPFPFVQRWDPQQQVDEWFGSKNKRGGKRKRAQRNQAQYYEDGDPQASKKRRVTGESMGVTFSDAAEHLEEGDTTLNYDDPPDEPPLTKAAAAESQATDTDDLPSLPADLTTLADFRPGEAKLGMVITWKQWLLSSATNWQPEVVNLTGILVRVHDEGGTDLEFLLAQRDREIDKTEKKYDEDTGERVYDRFEAPDDDDDDDDAHDEPDQGYRRLKYGELIEPKIVQLPLEDQAKPAGNGDSSVPMTGSIVHETVYDDRSQPYQSSGEDAGRPEADADGSQLPTDTGDDSRTKANTDDEQPRGATDSDSRLDAIDHRLGHSPGTPMDIVQAIDEADMSTPRAKTQASDANQPPTTEDAVSQNSNGNDALSISSDRRHDISVMIQDAGFRRDVSPSVLRHKTSSPSRQLLEMVEAASHSRAASRSPLSQESMVEGAAHVLNKEMGFGAGISGGGSAAPTSSASSIRSGRQFDPDDLSFNVSVGDLHQVSDMGDDEAPTPKAKAPTPTRDKETSVSPSSSQSLPSLASLARTASQQNLRKQTQSPSKAQVLASVASLDSRLQRNEEYEAAMRRIDESDGDEEEDGKDGAPLELVKTRKRHFPASDRAAESPLSESTDMPDVKAAVVKAASSPLVEKQGSRLLRQRQRVRNSSPFAVPPGSQVVSLSSSPSSSPPREEYAEDSIDGDYEDGNRRSSLQHSSGRAQKSRAPRASSRAKSVPAKQATTRSASARRSIPPSSMPANPGTNGRGQRMPSSRF
ncbi:hypothetical protein LX36DRAFT_661134 [Colletotrichum falcatum]|nr:hypothetical protein LX36DRAFT_661134 [Colletotrichum falcatum]